jgi:hypothetical protein
MSFQHKMGQFKLILRNAEKISISQIPWLGRVTHHKRHKTEQSVLELMNCLTFKRDSSWIPSKQHCLFQTVIQGQQQRILQYLRHIVELGVSLTGTRTVEFVWFRFYQSEWLQTYLLKIGFVSLDVALYLLFWRAISQNRMWPSPPVVSLPANLLENVTL